ncbi:MAG TPA: glycosyltransferase 87 family protein [Thermoleophilaceae bacterium]|nr:glycosyltransferase 87 family protein [Thermoleophilaceae bacterium]
MGTASTTLRAPVARAAAAYAGIAVMAVTSALVVAAAQTDRSTLVPSAKLRYPGWLHGPLSPFRLDLDTAAVAALLAAMLAGYLLALAYTDALSPRGAVGAIVGLHALFLLAPPLISSDVFGYVDLARLGTLHDVNPFAPASTPLPPDDVHLYRRWGTDLPSPYGPLFVLVGYALAPLGIAGAMWGFKVLVTLASLATIWLVWRCAEALGRDPVKAVVLVGLNPLVLLFAVGGAHNDFFATTAVTGAIYLLIVGRERLGGAALVAAAAVKIPLGLPLLFAAVRPDGPGTRRAELLRGAAIAAAVALALSLAVFGTDVVNFAGEVLNQQDRVATYSIPNQAGELLGLGGLTAGIRALAALALLATLAVTVRRTWRGGDWVAAAGWATFALLVTSAWLLPWYVTWLLPLAALSGDRRLRTASLCLTAYVVGTRLAIWL